MGQLKKVHKLVRGYDYQDLDPRYNDGMKYMLLRRTTYLSRYNKLIIGYPGYKWNGADVVNDLVSEGTMSMGPLIHDLITDKTPCFADGTPCSNWKASQILKDILKAEGRWVRMIPWRWMTFLFGGKNNKKGVGWF
jgi:hypothetical protein